MRGLNKFKIKIQCIVKIIGVCVSLSFSLFESGKKITTRYRKENKKKTKKKLAIFFLLLIPSTALFSYFVGFPIFVKFRTCLMRRNKQEKRQRQNKRIDENDINPKSPRSERIK